MYEMKNMAQQSLLHPIPIRLLSSLETVPTEISPYLHLRISENKSISVVTIKREQ